MLVSWQYLELTLISEPVSIAATVRRRLASNKHIPRSGDNSIFEFDSDNELLKEAGRSRIHWGGGGVASRAGVPCSAVRGGRGVV